MQHLTKQQRNQLPKDVRDDDRFYPTKKEQNRLEVYKDLGQNAWRL